MHNLRNSRGSVHRDNQPMPYSTYLPESMDSAVVEPTGSFEADSYQGFTLTYTACCFGIDDTGSLKIVHRFASDMGRLQFDGPATANYVPVEASNDSHHFKTHASRSL